MLIIFECRTPVEENFAMLHAVLRRASLARDIRSLTLPRVLISVLV